MARHARMKVPDLAHQRGCERLAEGRDVHRIEPSLGLCDGGYLRLDPRHLAQKPFLALGQRLQRKIEPGQRYAPRMLCDQQDTSLEGLVALGRVGVDEPLDLRLGCRPIQTRIVGEQTTEAREGDTAEVVPRDRVEGIAVPAQPGPYEEGVAHEIIRPGTGDPDRDPERDPDRDLPDLDPERDPERDRRRDPKRDPAQIPSAIPNTIPNQIPSAIPTAIPTASRRSPDPERDPDRDSARDSARDYDRDSEHDPEHDPDHDPNHVNTYQRPCV